MTGTICLPVRLLISFRTVVSSSQVLFDWPHSSRSTTLISHVGDSHLISHFETLTICDIGALNGTVIWSSIEPSIAVTSACLPTLRPLALYLFPQLASRVTRYEPDLERKKFMHRARGYAHMGSPWPGFENHKTSAGGPTASIFASLDNGDPKHDVILDQIKVHKDLHLTSEAV